MNNSTWDTLRLVSKNWQAYDDYLNGFRLLKARCFTQVPEHELVEMVAGGLDYSIRKKLDIQYLRDMAQLADKRSRLKFGDKPKQPMQVDTDPLKKADSMYQEIAGMNMVEISEIDPIVATDGPKVDVEMVTEGHKCVDIVITEDQYEEKIQVVYPKAEEDLIDFLNRCKISGFPVMMCPRCRAVFDKKAEKNVEGFRPKTKQKGKWIDKRPKFSFDKANIPFKDTSPTANQKKGLVKTFSPPSKSPNNQWVFDESIN